MHISLIYIASYHHFWAYTVNNNNCAKLCYLCELHILNISYATEKKRVNGHLQFFFIVYCKKIL